MAKKAPAQAANPYLGSAAPEDLSPANRIAGEIVDDRRDLLPSVEFIMNAGLDDATAAAALGLFRTALAAPGDPNRDPRTAIAGASGGGR